MVGRGCAFQLDDFVDMGRMLRESLGQEVFGFFGRAKPS